MYKITIDEKVKNKQHLTTYYYQTADDAIKRMHQTYYDLVEPYDYMKKERVIIHYKYDRYFMNNKLTGLIHVLNGINDEYIARITITNLGD